MQLGLLVSSYAVSDCIALNKRQFLSFISYVATISLLRISLEFLSYFTLLNLIGWKICFIPLAAEVYIPSYICHFDQACSCGSKMIAQTVVKVKGLKESRQSSHQKWYIDWVMGQPGVLKHFFFFHVQICLVMLSKSEARLPGQKSTVFSWQKSAVFSGQKSAVFCGQKSTVFLVTAPQLLPHPGSMWPRLSSESCGLGSVEEWVQGPGVLSPRDIHQCERSWGNVGSSAVYSSISILFQMCVYNGRAYTQVVLKNAFRGLGFCPPGTFISVRDPEVM